MVTAVDPALLALAGVGLSNARPIPRRGWARRLDNVVSNGLAGMLAEAYEQGLIDLDEHAADRLRARLQSEAIRAVQLEGELIRLEPVLAELDAVVLKGAVLAHSAYPDPALRPFTDLDLLVEGERHDIAVHALERYGYRRSRPEPIRGYDAAIGKALTLIHPGGVVIDLHRTLVAGLAGASVRVDEILAERGTVTVNDRPVPAPSWDAHLVEVCAHAVLGDGLGRALSLRDIAQVVSHPGLHADHAVELARRWKLAPTVATGLRAAVESFGIVLPPDLAALAEKSNSGKRPVASSVRSSRSRLAELRGGGLRRRFAVARSLVAPSREFLRFTYGNRSKPDLYLQRWRTLSRRTREARGARTAPPTNRALPSVLDTSRAVSAPGRIPSVPSSSWSTMRPPLGITPLRTRRPAADPTLAASRAAGNRSGPVPSTSALYATVARVRPHVGVMSMVPVDGLAPRSLSAAAMPPIPSRQERWGHARGPRARAANGVTNPGGAEAAPPPRPPVPSDQSAAQEPAAPAARSRAAAETGTALCVSGVMALLATSVAARVGINSAGVVLVPLAGILFAMAMSRHITRVRPDEDWVGRWLVLAVVVKIVASYVRYFTLVSSYKGNGDATGFDDYGRQFANAWMGNGVEPYLPDLRKTNFLRWFTGVVYYMFGDHMVAGFFVFGLLALVGSYLWYRATAASVPFLDKRLYLGLVLFAPSIAFWPSSIGKESLMQLGIGAMALATALFLRQRLIPGLLLGLAGGWVLWVVRPHLLALVTIAAGFAYLVGRVRSTGKASGSVATRTIGLVVIAFLVAFTIGQGMKFLGMKDLSLNSVETTLNEQQYNTGEGGSSFDNGGDYLSPVNLPRGFVTVLLRPFPWEADSPFGLLASLETAALAVVIVVRFSSIRTSLARARGTPFLLYCWVLTTLYAATFSSFANFGILVRQRSLVLPALFVLIAVRPVGKGDEDEAAEQLGSQPSHGAGA